MAVAKSSKQLKDTDSNLTGFDITAVVGRVEFGAGGSDAFLAAFELIGQSAREMPMNTERTFSFDPSGAESHFIKVAVVTPGRSVDPDYPDGVYQHEGYSGE